MITGPGDVRDNMDKLAKATPSSTNTEMTSFQTCLIVIYFRPKWSECSVTGGPVIKEIMLQLYLSLWL